MEKISKYGICLALNDAQKNYVYINGCHGVFQIVPRRIGEIVCKGAMAEGEAAEHLRKIHYLIPSEVDEEQRITRTLQKVRAMTEKYVSFSLIPSYRCNFHCPYCFEKDISGKFPDWMKTTLSKEAVDGIFAFADRLIEEGKCFHNIRLFGGEPLLPKHKGIVEYIGQKSLAYHIPIQTITNGYYIDEFADLIGRYPFAEFKITIDGTRDLHDSRRSPADTHKSFDRIITNVRMLLEQGKKVTLRTNINRENIGDILKLMQVYKELGFSEDANLNYYFKSTISCFEKPENGVSDREIMEALGNTMENYRLNSTYFRIYRQLRGLIDQDLYTYFKPVYCGASSGNYMFDSNGNVFSCWDMVTEPCSVVGQASRWGVTLNEQWKVWQNRTFEAVEKCKNCRYKMFCGGGCAAQAVVARGDMHKAVCDDFIENFNQVAITMAKEMPDTK